MAISDTQNNINVSGEPKNCTVTLPMQLRGKHKAREVIHIWTLCLWSNQRRSLVRVSANKQRRKFKSVEIWR